MEGKKDPGFPFEGFDNVGNVEEDPNVDLVIMEDVPNLEVPQVPLPQNHPGIEGDVRRGGADLGIPNVPGRIDGNDFHEVNVAQNVQPFRGFTDEGVNLALDSLRFRPNELWNEWAPRVHQAAINCSSHEPRELGHASNIRCAEIVNVLPPEQIEPINLSPVRGIIGLIPPEVEPIYPGVGGMPFPPPDPRPVNFEPAIYCAGMIDLAQPTPAYDEPNYLNGAILRQGGRAVGMVPIRTGTVDIDFLIREPEIELVRCAHIPQRELEQLSHGGDEGNFIIDLDNYERDKALQKFRVVQDMFPEAETMFLEAKCVEYASNDIGFQAFVIDTMIPGDYPKKALPDINPTELNNNAAEEHESPKKLDVPSFVKKYPDPIKHFKNNGSSVHYLQHVVNYLLTRYRYISAVYIRSTLVKNNYNFYISEVQIRDLPYSRRVVRRDSEMKKALGKPPVEYYDTVYLIENEWKILRYMKDVEVARASAVEEARQANALLECGCCFGDELLTEEVSNCTEGHIFCKECILRSSLVNMGDGKIDFPCLQDCTGYFEMIVLKDILPEVSFDKLERKLQEREVAAANISGLVSCPFCEYSAILPDETRIFDCDNCKKQSCRECRRISHIPLRCDEVKDDFTQERTYVEEKMTEALLRKCWKCGTKFIRVDGCNKMTCTCGAKMCYICRKPIVGYNHFYEKFRPNDKPPPDKCPLWTNNHKLHRLEVKTEEANAINVLKRKNPHFNPDLLKKRR